MSAIRVRVEAAADIEAIRAVQEQAFGQRDEADLVDALRDSGAAILSLVGDADGEVTGHVLFSRLAIESPGGALAGAALAPVAVRPDRQGQGVGGLLIRTGLDRCRRLGVDAVVVLGNPDYYGRFGFSARLAETLDAPFSGPAFMAMEFVPGALAAGGTVRYADAFFDLPASGEDGSPAGRSVRE